MSDSDFISLGLMVLVVWWIIGSVAVGVAAQQRGRGMGSWFWTSILVSPILAGVLLNAYPIKAIPATESLSITSD